MQLGVDTVPVLVGPVSYLLLSKPAKGVEKSFSLLSLIDKILPVFKYVFIISVTLVCFHMSPVLMIFIMQGGCG